MRGDVDTDLNWTHGCTLCCVGLFLPYVCARARVCISVSASARVLQATWKGLEEALDKKLTRAIGVSNFNVPQLKQILATAVTSPAVLSLSLSLSRARSPPSPTTTTHSPTHPAMQLSLTRSLCLRSTNAVCELECTMTRQLRSARRMTSSTRSLSLILSLDLQLSISPSLSLDLSLTQCVSSTRPTHHLGTVPTLPRPRSLHTHRENATYAAVRLCTSTAAKKGHVRTWAGRLRGRVLRGAHRRRGLASPAEVTTRRASNLGVRRLDESYAAGRCSLPLDT